MNTGESSSSIYSADGSRREASLKEEEKGKGKGKAVVRTSYSPARMAETLRGDDEDEGSTGFGTPGQRSQGMGGSSVGDSSAASAAGSSKPAPKYSLFPRIDPVQAPTPRTSNPLPPRPRTPEAQPELKSAWDYSPPSPQAWSKVKGAVKQGFRKVSSRMNLGASRKSSRRDLKGSEDKQPEEPASPTPLPRSRAGGAEERRRGFTGEGGVGADIPVPPVESLPPWMSATAAAVKSRRRERALAPPPRASTSAQHLPMSDTWAAPGHTARPAGSPNRQPQPPPVGQYKDMSAWASSPPPPPLLPPSAPSSPESWPFPASPPSRPPTPPPKSPLRPRPVSPLFSRQPKKLAPAASPTVPASPPPPPPVPDSPPRQTLRGRARSFTNLFQRAKGDKGDGDRKGGGGSDGKGESAK